jgi:uncharacterized membrane protein
MRRNRVILLLIVLLLLVAGVQTPALAQKASKQLDSSQSLTVFTRYPAQMVEAGETVTLPLTLRSAELPAQVVRLDVKNAPKGWTATFKGSGRIVEAVYVTSDKDASVDLRLEPPKDVSPGTYRFTVVARGEKAEAELPIELTVKEKVPSQLSFDVDLPTLRGTPTTTFRYSARLKNEGDQDLSVNLETDAPEGFQVSYKLTGQEVTSLPLKAKETKRLSIEVKPPHQAPAGQYPITVVAQGSDVQAKLNLTAEVTGRPELTVTAPDGRLSGQAYVGKETSLKIIVQNTGSAPARNVALSASQPSGWSVEFEPKQISAINPDKQVEVTAKIKPAEKAVAGDYMITTRVRADGGVSKSADFRITVLTSTLWGVVGIALIAVAVVVVGLAVVRFGRR